jgi:hypothetical protein
MSLDSKPPRILILYFSFSSQTKNLLQALASGVEQEKVSVEWERITTVQHLRFPIGSFLKTFWMMVLTFFRKRFAVEPLSEKCFSDYDLIVLAGPTWSYNPSGPVLAVFDRDGERLFSGREVLALISCRGYWRMHWWGLRQLLHKYKAKVSNVIVFNHPNPEPFNTVGVFLKLAGKIPERMWFSKYYTKYGHTNSQILEAERFGTMLGQALVTNKDISELDFRSKRAVG